MRNYLLGTLLLSVVTVGCAGSPLAPTTTASTPLSPIPIVLQYAINIPFIVATQELQRQYPTGISMSPIDAQIKYDYHAEYGMPNVYYGPGAPPNGTYQGIGIVIAPTQVAGETSFKGSEWPTMYVSDAIITWRGEFVYVPVRHQ